MLRRLTEDTSFLPGSPSTLFVEEDGEYWVVDPERREVALHRLAGEEYEVKRVKEGEIESSAVPDFWLKADWLFREPLPSVADCLRAVLGGEGTE